ncbi:MAG: hypothetical protein KDD84_07375, partial [Caldilineaceae bacterium]|nr:hypothetical protein [Caldilineaceae bacterium]
NRLSTVVILVTAGVIVGSRFGLLPGLTPISDILYMWVLVLGAFALVLGVVSVGWVHVGRVQRGEKEWAFSLVLLIGLLGVVVTGLLSPGGTTSPLMEWIFDALIAPGQASLFALTGLFVLAAAYRYLRLDRPEAVWILAGALLALLVQTPMTRVYAPPIVVALADWLLVWPIMAALRGVLLGGALAALFVALRLLVQGGRNGR